MSVLSWTTIPSPVSMLKLVLGKSGIDSKIAASGEEAIEMVRLRHAPHGALPT